MNSLKQWPRYDEMKGLLFVRDADRNANSAVDSLVDHIYRNWNIKLSKDGAIKQDADGVKIGFFIFPGQGIDGHFLDGALEDFCLDLFHDDEGGLDSPSLKSLVDSFIERLRAKRGKGFKTEHKNHLFLLLSSTDKAVGRKIGEAAKTGVFDFKNAKLEPLKKLILQMND